MLYLNDTYFILYTYLSRFFYRFDEEVGRVELDYPRDMAMWKGVGYNIDSVFQWKDGKKLLTNVFQNMYIVHDIKNPRYLFNVCFLTPEPKRGVL